VKKREIFTRPFRKQATLAFTHRRVGGFNLVEAA
jgi:hypothetical protein